MMKNRSKTCEGLLELLIPANFQRSGPPVSKSVDPGNLEKEALEIIQEARQRIGQSIRLEYGRGKYGRVHAAWTIRAGDFKAEDPDFLQAVKKFILQVYPEYDNNNQPEQSDQS